MILSRDKRLIIVALQHFVPYVIQMPDKKYNYPSHMHAPKRVAHQDLLSPTQEYLQGQENFFIL